MPQNYYFSAIFTNKSEAKLPTYTSLLFCAGCIFMSYFMLLPLPFRFAR